MLRRFRAPEQVGVKVLDVGKLVTFSNAALDLKSTANVLDVPLATKPVGYLQLSDADLVLDLATWGMKECGKSMKQ